MLNGIRNTFEKRGTIFLLFLQNSHCNGFSIIHSKFNISQFKISWLKFSIPAFLIFNLAFVNLRAQQLYFSQYHYAWNTINPAITAIDNHADISFLIRNSRYIQHSDVGISALAIHAPLVSQKKNNRWGGFGISAYNNNTAQDNFFQQRGASFAFAGNFSILKTKLAIGLQGDFTQKSLSTEGFTTGSQWIENEGHNTELSIDENFSNLFSNYWSVSPGIYWYQTNERERQQFHLHVATFHLNQPNATFLDAGSSKLPIQWVAGAGYELLSMDKWSITPEILYRQQADHILWNAGAKFSFHFRDVNPFDIVKSGSLDLHARYVNNNTIMLALQLNQPDFSIGFSYDFGLSQSPWDFAPLTRATELAFTIRKTINHEQKKHKKNIEKVLVEQRQLSTDKSTTAAPSLTDSAKTVVEESFEFYLNKYIDFGFNTTRISRKGEDYLDKLVELLEANPNLKIEIIGHADNKGEENANQIISLQRAQAVANYLIEKGINKNRLTSVGKGSSEPIAPNDTEENRAKNRRVDIRIGS